MMQTALENACVHTIYVLIVMQKELSIQNEMQLLSPKMLIELDLLF